MTAGPKISRLRAVARLSLLLVASAVLLGLYAVSPRSARRWRRRVQVWWCRTVCGLTGLTVRTLGTPFDGGRALICANHVSYLDIAVLSRSVAGVYVAKSEVARWPLFGAIARVTGTVFVDRTPAKAHEQRQQIDDRVRAGDALILFPEGTSTDGTAVAPFKSSLFEIARPGATTGGMEAGVAAVQPVSIAYIRAADGTPLTGERTDWYGWYGDMSMAPHLFRVAAMRGAEVEVRFHPVIRPDSVADRKDLARRCHEAIAAGVAAAHAAAAGDGAQAPGGRTGMGNSSASASPSAGSQTSGRRVRLR